LRRVGGSAQEAALPVDLDQHASATRYLDLDLEASPSLYDVLTCAQSTPRASSKTTFGTDVLPSHIVPAGNGGSAGPQAALPP
jgi:cellulose biosynthesis protein BcsQ